MRLCLLPAFASVCSQDCSPVMALPQRRSPFSPATLHLPSSSQNRDLFMVTGGDGSLALHKYHYPDRRCVLLTAAHACLV